MAAKTINLEGVQAAIARVSRQIEALRGKVDPAERGILDKKLAQMRKLSQQTGALCTKAWGVWPMAKKTTRRGAAKGRRRK
jgi:hypothetical protein